MFQPGLVPLGVALHARRISHPELRCDIVQHHQRHIQRIGQERPHMTNRDQLQRPPEPVVITTPLRHKIPVRVVEEEEPLQHRLIRRPSRVPAIRRESLIRQESGRHERSTYGTFTR
jgi:hypothetical protein